MCKVTAIVPNFNHAGHLKRRLESIANQTYKNFELIILDDASTDDSLQVITSFVQSFPARVIVNKKNSGSPFKQWNLGVQHAQGKYVWLAEADDDARPDLLMQLVDKLESNPDVVLSYCDSLMIDGDGRPIQRTSELYADLNSGKWNADYINVGHDECSRFLIFRNTVPNASGVVFRRDMFLKAGGACEDLKLSGDWMTWAKMLILGDVSYVSEPLNYFRTHSGSVRHRTSAKMEFEEALQVRSFIKKSLSISPEVVDQVALTNRREWEKSLWKAESMPSIIWFHKVRLAVKPYGPNGTRRMVKTYVFIWLARMPAMSRIKRFFLGSRNSPRGANTPMQRILEFFRERTR